MFGSKDAVAQRRARRCGRRGGARDEVVSDAYQQEAVGDVDGDGYADWLISNVGNNGEAHVLSGKALSGTVDYPGPADALWVYAGDAFDSYSYEQFEPIGDFDGDGLADIGASDHGDVYRVILGSSVPLTDADIYSSADLSIDGPDASFDAIGDLNGDGRGDLSVMSHGIHVVFGQPGKDGLMGADQAKLVIAPGSGASNLRDVGDLNGDAPP